MTSKPADEPTSDEIAPGEAFLMAAFEPANLADPYPLYATTREQHPVLDAGNGLWITFSHGAAHQLLRTPTASTDEKKSQNFIDNVAHDEALQAFAEREQSMLFLDPPDHTRLRSLVSSAFTPSTVKALGPKMRTRIDGLLDVIADQGADGSEVDLIDSLAYQLPVSIICEMLGVPPSDWNLFGEWSTALTKMLDPSMLRSPDDDAAALAAEDELRAYIVELLSHRRTNPSDDVISALLQARDGEDSLSETEVITMVVLLLIAGHETTTNLIGNGIVALLRNPDQLETWRNDPSLDRQAVNELLRFDSPVQIAMRVVTEPTDMHGVVVPANNQVLMSLGAANHDPEVFEDPSRLDLTRANAGFHLSFGGGIHHCLGMALARIEGELALSTLIRRFPSMTLAADLPRRPTFVLRGYERVPVTLV